MLDSHVNAWAAGLFDGEGYVLIEKPKPPRRLMLRLSVRMTHQPTIDRLAKTFPGGRRRGPIKNKGNCKEAHHVEWNGKKGEPFLRAIRPYLFTKAHEADIAFDFLAAPKGPIGDAIREACCLALRTARGKLEKGAAPASSAIASAPIAPNPTLQQTAAS